jgi:two-component system OmpR family response regulator
MGDMRVLVVEDEVALADAIARGLKAESFDVDVVHDGREGYEKARDGAYDLMVLDIMLPSMNGYRVCRALREDEVWTPILMLTAKDGEYDEAEALDTGADDFLSKPFSFVVLVARLRALARRRTDHNLQPLEAGDLVLDVVSRACRRGDVEISLSPREFALLEALLRHKDEIVSKQELLERVWGEEFEGDPNVVEVYVGYLRRKVDRPFGRTDLETIRGEGYRIRATEPAGS